MEEESLEVEWRDTFVSTDLCRWKEGGGMRKEGRDGGDERLSGGVESLWFI